MAGDFSVIVDPYLLKWLEDDDVLICAIALQVKCSHIICQRMQVPSLGFAELAEAAFIAGPPAVQKFSGVAR